VYEWLKTGFRLIIRFIEHLCTQFVTTSNCSAITNSHTLKFATVHNYVFSVCCVFTSRCLVTASNGGRSPSAGFPNCSLASAITFSQQQLTTTEPRQSSNSLTHQPTQSTPLTLRLAAMSHQTPTLLTAVSRFSRNGSCSSLCSLGMDRISDTSPNSSSTVASRTYRTDSVENTVSQLLHCCVLPCNWRVCRAVP
jgi:hypothetical protein